MRRARRSAHALAGRVGLELRLVVQGGLRILEKIARDRLDADVCRDARRSRWHDAALLRLARARACGRLATGSGRRRARHDARRSTARTRPPAAARASTTLLFLPPPRRAAITALYAFCREVDDVVDEVSDPRRRARPSSPGGARRSRPASPAQPSHPVTRALHAARRRFGIEPRTCRRSSTAARWISSRPATSTSPDWSATAIWSPASWARSPRNLRPQPTPATLDYAHKLGLAFQLTNIIRDVGEDARRGRIYLPVERTAAVRREGARTAAAQPTWGYSDRFRR